MIAEVGVGKSTQISVGHFLHTGPRTPEGKRKHHVQCDSDVLCSGHLPGLETAAGQVTGRRLTPLIFRK